MDIFDSIAKLFKINDQHVAKFLMHCRIDTWALIAICEQVEFLVCYTYCFKCHLIANSGTVFINSAMGKNSLTVLLAASIVELGIRRTKEPSGLGKTL